MPAQGKIQFEKSELLDFFPECRFELHLPIATRVHCSMHMHACCAPSSRSHMLAARHALLGPAVPSAHAEVLDEFEQQRL
jgi:hypothetical protein